MFSWQHTVGQRWPMQQQPKLKADIILSDKMWQMYSDKCWFS